MLCTAVYYYKVMKMLTSSLLHVNGWRSRFEDSLVFLLKSAELAVKIQRFARIPVEEWAHHWRLQFSQSMSCINYPWRNERYLRRLTILNNNAWFRQKSEVFIRVSDPRPNNFGGNKVPWRLWRSVMTNLFFVLLSQTILFVPKGMGKDSVTWWWWQRSNIEKNYHYFMWKGQITHKWHIKNLLNSLKNKLSTNVKSMSDSEENPFLVWKYIWLGLFWSYDRLADFAVTAQLSAKLFLHRLCNSTLPLRELVCPSVRPVTLVNRYDSETNYFNVINQRAAF